ncbi:MAG: sulfatase-like hydrolase/transferase [Planctomycetaceae bacterium]
MRRIAFVLFALSASSTTSLSAGDRPNILWIISEDTGPEIGCYGDEYAVTPNIDRLASEGLRFTFCWSNCPVCAPARTTMISGMYPSSTGAEHMRSLVRLPDGMQMFPQLLREAGYFTTNARKEDFNLEKPGQLWDVKNDAVRPWRKRNDDRPFFSIINIPTSHESQLRIRPHTLVHDPAKARIPAYHPDTPEVRHDWAQYYDKVTEMDREVGEILARLEEDSLTDETIVFYFGDHGSGMPRHKRWPFDSGLHVPLVIRIPEKFHDHHPVGYKPGASTEQIVSFIDFAPTALSLAGMKAPEYYQGVAFLGEHCGTPCRFLHGVRGRMDERIDCIRSVTDGRYVYVRHYLPHRPYGQHLGYMFQTPTTQVWKRLYDEGKLNEVQSAIWEEKPTELLFDLVEDPDEIHNLVDSPDHRDVLTKLRDAQRTQALTIRDVGLLPESLMHDLCDEHGVTPYELGHEDDLYPLERVLETAELASQRDASLTPQLVERLDDEHAAVRYWATVGLLVRKEDGYRAAKNVNELLDDPSPSVSVTASELIGRYGDDSDAEKAIAHLIETADYRNTDEYSAAYALLVLDELLTARRPLIEAHAAELEALPVPEGKEVNQRARDYPKRLKATIEERL